VKVILELKEKPSCCYECPLAIKEHSSATPWCIVTKQDICKGIRKDCPLKTINE
jgi:hypothetical protein